MGNKKIQSLIEDIVTLPSLPGVVTKVTAMITDESASVSDVAAIIAGDPSLSLKAMRLVNSAFYGMRHQITSVEHAAALLGMKVLKNLVLTASVFTLFKGKGKHRLFNQSDFWSHSINCGLAGRAIVKTASKGELVDPEEAFIAGLLHDIGKLVFSQYMFDDFDKALTLAEIENRPLHEAEKQVIGVDHAEIGGALAEKWNLPENLISAILMHHDPLATDPPSYLALVICFANSLSKIDETEDDEAEGDAMDYSLPGTPEIRAALQLEDDDVAAVMEAYKTEAESASALLSLAESE
ncbi:HDOD domain-containing protein [Candidatus Hydrogenedentota bacterium]